MKKEIFPITLVLILALSRLIPHPPNFTPIIAVAIMSAYFFKNVYFSLAVLLISMFISDIFIGFYNNMLLIYFTISLISFTFFQFAKILNSKNLLFFSLAGSVIFFVISNFGVWLIGYPKTISGFIACYVAALPFLLNTLISTLIFSSVFHYCKSFNVKEREFVHNR